MNEDHGIKTIRFSGELEISRKNEIRQALCRTDEDRAVLIDLAEVTYADSVALTELLRFCVDSQRDAIPVALVIQTPQLARVVQYAGLATAFKTFDDVGAAAAHLAETIA